jgi:hypothetical protein
VPEVDQRHVVAMQRKMSAHIAADGSAAEHYDTLTHYFLPCSLVTSVVCLRRPHLADIREDGWHNLSSVIAGLDPAIHLLRKKLLAKKMDPRVKPAGDAGGWARAASK